MLIVCSQLFRERLIQLLEAPGATFTYGTRTVGEAIDLMSEGDAPDLVIAVLVGAQSIDEAMSPIALARKRFANTRWLLLADTITPRRLRQALAAGVDGLLPHEITTRVLIHATELLLLGQSLLPTGLAELDESDHEVERPPSHVEPLNQEWARGPRSAYARSVQFSQRERQILDCLAKGYSNKLIANELEITDATVKVHVKALLRKLRVTNRTQAAIFALRNRALN